MTRRPTTVLLGLATLLCCGVSPLARGADVLVTADANISALVTADNTTLRWTGNFTVTVDAAGSKTVAGIDAGSFTATIDFQNANRKILLGNTAGNVVFEASGGTIVIAGAGTGARTAGFLISPSLSNETVEVRTSIDDAVNANYWSIGNHTLLLAGTSPEIGALDIGSDGGIAKIDVDVSGTIDLITTTGDFTIDVASGKTVLVTTAWTVGDNTVTLQGASSSSSVTNGAQVTLDNANSVLAASGTITLDDLDLGANATISLNDGATLTLTDSISVGARTLTLKGTTGSLTDTITATGGFQLDNASSVLKIEGDSANPLVVSKVATGADLTVGKGIDADQSVDITTFTVSHNATLDVASGKTLGGTVTLNAAKTLTLNNIGTVSAIATSTAAGTVNMTAAGTIATLTNGFSGATVDIDEGSTITTLTSTENVTVNVASGKTLTTTATIPAGKILTADSTGTISSVILNGLNAELFVTGGGIIGALNVNVDGGILDVDTNNCTVTSCIMKAGSGDLTLQNTNRTITSTSGFDVNNNTLTVSEASGTVSLVTMDTAGGILDINESTTFTATSISAAVTAKVATSKTLTTTATLSASGDLTASEVGRISAVTLNGSGAEFNTSGGGTVTTFTVAADGGVLNVTESCTLTDLVMSVGVGNLTLDVDNGKTLVSAVDVNDNTLTLADTGIPGTITLDTDGGVLDVDASCTPTALTIGGDVTLDLGTSVTLTATANISSNTLTLSGTGTVSRVDATTGTITANAKTTISDLRASFGTGGTFTYGGTGDSIVTTFANSTMATGETFKKTGSGTLTVTEGIGLLFTKAATVRVSVDAGVLQNGPSGTARDVTFDDDGDELVIESGATFTTWGDLNVTVAGSNVNVDALEGSTVNLSGTTGTLTAAANNDFHLRGTVNVNGSSGTYSMVGAFIFQFGDLNISGTSALVNQTPSSFMQFVPDSVVELIGSGDAGGRLDVDGQATTTRIVMTTTTGSGTFTIDRNGSDNLTIDNVTLSNAIYLADGRGAAIDDINLSNTADAGGNSNWFVAASVVDEEDDEPVDEDESDDDVVEDDADDPFEEPVKYVGDLVVVSADGSADTVAESDETGATGVVTVSGGEAGSFFVTVADGNLWPDFNGIPDENALDVTLRVTSSVTGDFSAVVELCYTEDLLADTGLESSELVLYTYDEPSETWELAGLEGRYRGDRAPSSVVGDYGYDSESMCVWVVRDEFSDFAAGRGPTDSDDVSDEEAAEVVEDGEDVEGDADSAPAVPPLCGLFGMMSLGLTLLGVVGLRYLGGTSR